MHGCCKEFVLDMSSGGDFLSLEFFFLFHLSKPEICMTAIYTPFGPRLASQILFCFLKCVILASRKQNIFNFIKYIQEIIAIYSA
jgi:hypothetical protein